MPNFICTAGELYLVIAIHRLIDMLVDTPAGYADFKPLLSETSGDNDIKSCTKCPSQPFGVTVNLHPL